MQRDPEETLEFLTQTYRNAKFLVIGIVSAIGIIVSIIALRIEVGNTWTSVQIPLYAAVASVSIVFVLLSASLLILWTLYRRSVRSSSFFRIKALNLEAAVRGLEELAYTDAITGIPNSNALEKELSRTAKHTRRCLIMLDLLNFGAINKTYNHWVGDEYLRNFSSMVVAKARRNEFMYKSRPRDAFSPDGELGVIGGNNPKAFRKSQGSDEFFILLEGPLIDGLGFLNRLKGREDEFQVMSRDVLGKIHPFGFHAGVTSVAINEPYESVIARVSHCLGRAQELDSRSYVCWSPELPTFDPNSMEGKIHAKTKQIFERNKNS